MEAKDALSLRWITADWSSFTVYPSAFDDYVAYTRDIRIFIDTVYHDVSRELKIPYEELYPILEKENEAVCQILKDTRYLYPHNMDLFKQLFKVPSMEFNQVEACLNLFEKLSDVEKVEFLQKIGKISVQVEQI